MDILSRSNVQCSSRNSRHLDENRSQIRDLRLLSAIATSWTVSQRIIAGTDRRIKFCSSTAAHNKAAGLVTLLILAAIARIGQYICLSEQIAQLALNSTAKKREWVGRIKAGNISSYKRSQQTLRERTNVCEKVCVWSAKAFVPTKSQSIPLLFMFWFYLYNWKYIE